MVRPIWVLVMLSMAGFLGTSSAFAQEKVENEPWTGKLGNGTVITEVDLQRILDDHKQWSDSLKEEGTKADLSKADLRGPDLSKAELRITDLSKTIYEPKIGTMPLILRMIDCKNLERLTFSRSTHGHIRLLKEFREKGFREHEQKITHALKHSTTQHMLDINNFWKQAWGYAQLVLFEWTSDWGMSPWNRS